MKLELIYGKLNKVRFVKCEKSVEIITFYFLSSYTFSLRLDEISW